MRHIDEVRRALSRYTPLSEALGLDNDGEIKVYNLIAKPNTTQPYLIVNFPPVNDFEGAYEEAIVMEAVGVQLTAWATEPGQSLIIASMANNALLDSDFDVAPYEVVSVRRIANPFPQFDPDANLHGLVMRYEMILAK